MRVSVERRKIHRHETMYRALMSSAGKAHWEVIL